MKLSNLIIQSLAMLSLLWAQLEKVEPKPNPTKQVEFGEFFKKITPIIEQYVSEKKIDIVLDRKNVFVASKKKDITQEIINIIDSKIK